MGTLYEVNGTTGNITSVKSLASTQWNGSIGGGGETILQGTSLDYFSLFNNLSDKVTAGSTSYYEFNILDDRKATFDTNTGNPMQVVYNGVDLYNGAWNTSFKQTVLDFVTAQNLGGAGTLLGDHGIRCGVDDAGATAELRMSTDNGGSGDLGLLTITTGAGFSSSGGGLSAAAPARIQIQYTGTPVENQFITHNFRLNWTCDPGGGAAAIPHSLTFKRWGNGTTIGAPYTFQAFTGASDPNGVLIALISYTSSPTDAFVTQGFTFTLTANPGDDLDLTASSAIGCLIETYLQQPTHFP